MSFPLRAGKLAVATAAAMLCLAGPVAGKAKPPPCPGGFFLVDGEPLVSGALGVPDAVVLQGGSLAVLSGCGPTVARVKGTKRGTRVKAKWSSCAGLGGRVRLRARIDASCTGMSGKLRAKGHKRRFTARLSSGTGFGFCGDGRVDPGEDCDPPNAAAGCDDSCRRGGVCGNGIPEDFEACDDGNTLPCDGCAADCSRRDAVCGDGIVECGEACEGRRGCAASERCGDACQCESAELCGDAASSCGDRHFCGANDGCICIRSAEGEIRCGRIPSCGIQLCETSEDCAILGTGYFCDTPNSGCCSVPPKELPRCIAPCTPTTSLPSCSTKAFTDAEIDAAVGAAVAGVADPWGKGLSPIFSRAATALGCDLGGGAAAAAEGSAMPLDLTPADCSSAFCSNIRYCGRGNSESNPSFPFPANGSCLNRACFEHDTCYEERCIANDCLWSPQATACDQAFFDACNSCNPLNEEGHRPSTFDAITCSIARNMTRRTQEAKCNQPSPTCVGCEVCQDGVCVDSPPVGYQTCDDECCQGPCAPEGGCCSAFRFCQNATVCCPLGQSCISPTDRAPFCCSTLQACQDGGFGEKKVCCEDGQSCKCSLAGCGCQ